MWNGGRIKIGLICIGYQCPNLVGILYPFIASRCGIFTEDGDCIEAPLDNINFKICCVSALFKERQEFGELYSNVFNEEILNRFEMRKQIDKFIIEKKPILDFESRNIALDYLRQFNVDYYWQLDLEDEFYETNHIVNTIKFIQKEPLVSSFRINFKNYIGENKYIKDFNPIRILNNKVHGGLDSFYFDNDAKFKDGSFTPQSSCMNIPDTICNPRHLSWVGTPERLSQKISYQKAAIGTCSYKMIDNKLTFDPEYYKKFNKQIPQIHEDINV